MPKLLVKNKGIVFALVLGLILTVAGLTGLIGKIVLPKVLAATATQTVEVTATVEAWLQFTANPSSVTLLPSLVDSAGTGHIGSSTNVTLNLGTNAVSGWNITIEGKYAGLCHSSATGTTCSTSSDNLIVSVPTGGTTALSAGTDGYGANATPTLSGVTIGTYYNNWNSDTVGAIASSTSQTLASKSTPNASVDVAYLKIKAASEIAQKSGSYYDTITLTATTVP